MTELCSAMNQWQQDDVQQQYYTTSLAPVSQDDNYIMHSTPRNFVNPVQFSGQRNCTYTNGFPLYGIDVISSHNFTQTPYFSAAYRPFESDICVPSQSQEIHHLDNNCVQIASDYSQSSSSIVPSSFTFFETMSHISASKQCFTPPQMDDVPVKYEAQLSLPLLPPQYQTTSHVQSSMPNQTYEIVDKSKSPIDLLMEVIQSRDSKSSNGADTGRLSRLPATKRLRSKTRRGQRGASRTTTSSEHRQRSSVREKAQRGEKINRCKWEGCDFVTNQYGNLQSHERVHSGLKPYKCDFPQCDKRFKQQGQVDAHRATHGGERFKCRLDNCGKGFTQRGNMKNHQERAHCRSIADYRERFERTSYAELPSDEQDIYLYFQETYKYANKGIKGRGKGTKYVSQVDICSGYSPASSPSTSTSSSPPSTATLSSRMTSPCLSSTSQGSRNFSVSSASSDMSYYMPNNGASMLINDNSALSAQIFSLASYPYRSPAYDGNPTCSMLSTYQTD